MAPVAAGRGGAPGAEADGLGQDATTDGVEAVVLPAAAGQPLAHLADERCLPDRGVGAQGAGGEDRVEGAEDALVLGRDAHLLGHGDRELLVGELAAQQGRQVAADAVGLDRDHRLVLGAQEGDHLPAQLGRGVHLGESGLVQLQILDAVELYLELRPERPGGDIAIQGAIKLRSMFQILKFLADNTGDAKEFDIPADTRMGAAEKSPAETMRINVTEEPPVEQRSVGFLRWAIL